MQRLCSAGVETLALQTLGVPVSNRGLPVAGGIIQPCTLKNLKSVFQFFYNFLYAGEQQEPVDVLGQWISYMILKLLYQK